MRHHLVGTAAAAVTAALALLAARPAAASEEEIHAWRRVTVTVTAGDFGDVEVTAEAAPPPQSRLKSVGLTVKGKKLVVPAAALKDAPAIRLETLAVHSERGYDQHPWLYVVIKVAKGGLPAGAVDGWLYFAVQDGKLRHRALKTRDAKGQYKFDQKPISAAPLRARTRRA
jgi:hypothetical protein